MGRKKKEWLTTIDGRERPEHAAANGQMVSIQDAFTVGGERLRFPGDPNGSAWNTINCRCTELPVIGEAGIPEEARPEPSTVPIGGFESTLVQGVERATKRTQAELAKAANEQRFQHVYRVAGYPEIAIAETERGWGTGLARSTYKGIEISKRLAEKAETYNQTVVEVLGHESGHKIILLDEERWNWGIIANKVRLHGGYDPMAIAWGQSREGEAWASAIGQWVARKELAREVEEFILRRLNYGIEL